MWGTPAMGVGAAPAMYGFVLGSAGGYGAVRSFDMLAMQRCGSLVRLLQVSNLANLLPLLLCLAALTSAWDLPDGCTNCLMSAQDVWRLHFCIAQLTCCCPFPSRLPLACFAAPCY